MRLLLFILLTITSLYASFQTKVKEFTINDVTKNTAKIKVGNLQIGQSGIILHKYNQTQTIILTIATVTSTSNNESTLNLNLKNDILKQRAIPTSNFKVQNGDTFVLNHLYSSSLLLVPNFETSQKIKSLYLKQNFINPDIFTSYLKIKSIPIPTQKEIQDFCKSQDIGTLYIAVKNYFYIVDINSFKIIHKTPISVSDEKFQSPFYTKVEKIEQDFWDFDDAVITNYDEYYSKILGLK